MGCGWLGGRDLTTPDGVRVEVKSAAYLQSWAQKELSRISSGHPGCWRGMRMRGFAGVARRHAQVYVFALLGHTNKATVNPLDLDQWVFYVLLIAVLDGRARSPALDHAEDAGGADRGTWLRRAAPGGEPGC